MEACTMKPEVKKKSRLPEPPPKPAEMKRNDPERREQGAPLVPQRPSDAELSQTHYWMERATATNTQANGNLIQRQTKEKPSETPVVPHRPTEKELNATRRYGQHGRSSEVAEVDADIKQSNQTGAFRRSQTEKTPSFTSYLIDDCDKEGNSGDVPAKPEKAGVFGSIFKKWSRLADGPATEEDREIQKELSDGSGHLSEERNICSNVFKKRQKPAEGAAADQELDMKSENQLSGSCENLFDPTVLKEKKGGLAGIFKRSSSIGDLFEEVLNAGEDRKLPTSWENLLEATTSKEKTGGQAGVFRKSPKPSLRSVATKDPLSDSKDLSASCDSLTDTAEDDLAECSTRNKNLSEAASAAEESEDKEASGGGRLRRRRTIKEKRQVVLFRVKKTLSKIPKLILTSQSSDKMPIVDESLELQEVQPVEMAAYPTEDGRLESEQESNELMEWWNSVKGWTDWNETSNFQEGDEEMEMEQAADRVYMAARLFVFLFNQRGASLQHRILELLCLADAADQFHKKTVKAAVGGGVASVAGSVATITGLILAPFTFGASIIVTAVGISVATAGSITSATANITDTVHSSMDRKKLEKMIQSYQEEIKDIQECLEFVQDGMDTLQRWDFDKYSESAAKKALNHNVKHVMKEGGRAGKALVINTNKLITTVQLLGAAGGAAKAVRAISATTGVMSGLFLALDVFFLAKNSHELRKGATTKFATKIRGVCKELQDGLLELNKVKTELQKTIDGIEVEEYEQTEEVEVEVDEDLESDPKKLAELEQELDLLEEKLDKKAEEEQKKIKEMDLKNKEEKSMKEMGEKDAKKEGNKESKKGKSEEESRVESLESKNETVKASKEELLKEQPQKGKTKDQETENRITAGKESGSTRRYRERPQSERSHKQSDSMESRRRTEEDRGGRHWKAKTAKRREGRRERRELKRGSKREDCGNGNVSEESRGCHETVTRKEHSERERGSCREEEFTRARGERGEEERGSRCPRARANALLEHGLNI